MSETTLQLRDNICYKGTVVKKFEKYDKDDAFDFRPTAQFRGNVKLCLERARYLTESFKQTEGDPYVIRRAKALVNIWDKMTIYINEGERIVGNFASDPTRLPIYPELVHRWLDKALDDGFRNLLSEEEKKECREISEYWEGKSVGDRVRAALPNDLKDYVEFNGACYTNHFEFEGALPLPKWEELLRVGFKDKIKQIEENLEKLKESYDMESMTPGEYIEKKNAWEAMLIAAKGFIRWANRYADKAEEMAKETTDKSWKKQLLEIAGICRWVPENPARTFQEALQYYLFVHINKLLIEYVGEADGLRFDYVMGPFYQKDKTEGRITREEAQELIEHVIIKLEEFGRLYPPELHGVTAGGTLFQAWDLGGVTPEGKDATNELSYLVIDAQMKMRCIQPSLVVRYHPNIPQDFILHALDLVRTGIGYPSFHSDQAIIPQIVNCGIPYEDAVNYTIAGCVSWVIPGKNMRHSHPNAGFLSLTKCLELALYQGKDKDNYTGRQLGAKTPDPETFKSIEELMDAYLAQVRFIVDKMVRIDNISQDFYCKYLQRPFMSLVLDGNIEKGVDATAWAWKYSFASLLVCGNTNVADSLAAIKKYVFDEKKLTLEEIIEACRTNFEGKEELRQMLLSAPKFGNDDDYVDEVAREVHVRTQKVVEEFKDYYGFKWTLDGSGVSGYHAVSRGSGATPDGRKDSESCADAVISPMAGRDIKGPTAVLRSTSKIKPINYPHLLNQKFMPQFLEGENKKIFAQYLKTWSDLGHWHAQFNVVDEKTLRDAQANPEKHSNLAVRVAGYSAYFVDLTKELQEDIIARCEQTFN